MAVSNVYQREIVEVPFVLPDGKVLPHPALVISCDDFISSPTSSIHSMSQMWFQGTIVFCANPILIKWLIKSLLILLMEIGEISSL